MVFGFRPTEQDSSPGLPNRDSIYETEHLAPREARIQHPLTHCVTATRSQARCCCWRPGGLVHVGVPPLHGRVQRGGHRLLDLTDLTHRLLMRYAPLPKATRLATRAPSLTGGTPGAASHT
jgi:hypothetical protein